MSIACTSVVLGYVCRSSDSPSFFTRLLNFSTPSWSALSFCTVDTHCILSPQLWFRGQGVSQGLIGFTELQSAVQLLLMCGLEMGEKLLSRAEYLAGPCTQRGANVHTYRGCPMHLWERELPCTCCVMLQSRCDASLLHNFGPDFTAANWKMSTLLHYKTWCFLWQSLYSY